MLVISWLAFVIYRQLIVPIVELKHASGVMAFSMRSAVNCTDCGIETMMKSVLYLVVLLLIVPIVEFKVV